jgi:hypothetical protein
MTPAELLHAATPVAVTFVLALGIAWTHRHAHRGTSYTQDFAHTLILIATVTPVLVQIIGNNMAMGLALFAAFSVIRFPRNLGQTSDLAFLFLAIATGMVAGSGWLLTAAIVAAFGCAVMLWLHHRDLFAPYKAGHVLTLSLASDADFESMLAPVFAAHTSDSRLLSQRLVAAGESIQLRYGLRLKPGTGTPVLIESLHQACGNRRLKLEPADQEFDIER